MTKTAATRADVIQAPMGSRALGARPHAKLIAVASGKGGVGKTWLSITLSQALSEAGQSTLLFDGDLGLANVDVQLGLMPDHDLAEVLQGRCSLQEARSRSESGGFDVIAGRSGSGGLAGLAPEKLAEVTDSLFRLAGDYDRVVVDLAAGVERPVRFLAAQCGLCLVVLTDEPTSMTDAYAFIKLTLARSPRSDLRIVVNQAASLADGERTYEALAKACESFLRVRPPLLAIVPRDPKVKASIRSQAPLLSRFPNSPAAESLRRLAGCILNRDREADPAPLASLPSG